MNADDGAKMQATYDAGTASDVATACAMGCLADTSKIKQCVSDCVNSETGISKPCSDCYGGIIECTAGFCLGICASSPGSDECTKCQCDNNCYSQFGTCSGVTESPCAAP